MIDGRDTVRAAAQSQGPVTNRLDLVCSYLQQLRSKAGFWSRRGPVQVSAGIPTNFLHGSSFDRIAEFIQLSRCCCAPRSFVSPEQLERFLQVPSTHQRRVASYQRGKPFLLTVVPIPGILQQQPTPCFESSSLLGSELAPRFATGRIHGLVQMLDDVESVEQNLRVHGLLATSLA